MVPNQVRYQTALHLEVLLIKILFNFFSAGVEGLEPPAHGFGDRRSTN